MALSWALSAPIQATAGRVPSLNGLRAVSIGLVLVGHLVSEQVPAGYGVFLFFVISGFLITRLMFAEMKACGRVSISAFYRRRVFRLYPVILIYCLVIVGITSMLVPAIDWLEPLSALFYFANYLVPYREAAGIEYQMPFRVFWSLSVEEHFYIFFPLAFALLRGRPSNLITLVLAICVSALLLRFVGTVFVAPQAADSHFFYMRTEFRADAIAYGVLLAACCEAGRGRHFVGLCDTWVALALASALLVAAVLLPPLLKPALRDTLMGVAIVTGMAALLFGSKLSWLAAVLNLGWVDWVGKLSYSLYVWHVPADMVVQTWFPLAWPLSFVATFAAASASHYWVERPMIAFGKGLGSATSRRLVPDTAVPLASAVDAAGNGLKPHQGDSAITATIARKPAETVAPIAR